MNIFISILLVVFIFRSRHNICFGSVFLNWTYNLKSPNVRIWRRFNCFSFRVKKNMKGSYGKELKRGSTSVYKSYLGPRTVGCQGPAVCQNEKWQVLHQLISAQLKAFQYSPVAIHYAPFSVCLPYGSISFLLPLIAFPLLMLTHTDHSLYPSFLHNTVIILVL